MKDLAYSPIEDHGAIGNLRTSALVSLSGSIDWCCLPHLDDPSVFAALLDHERGGRWQVKPAGDHGREQWYIEHTNVLETAFRTDAGRLVVTDFMPLAGSLDGVGGSATEPAFTGCCGPRTLPSRSRSCGIRASATPTGRRASCARQAATWRWRAVMRW